MVRVLRLPVAGAGLESLAAEAAPHHPAYALRTFEGPVPRELRPDFGRLLGSLVTEMPKGATSWEREVYSEESLDHEDGALASAGRHRLTTVALTAGGEPVAYSDLVTSEHDPDHVYQWGTLLRPDHRGHRLGLATKVANLARLQSVRPRPGLLFTCNAEVNAPMVAVNQRLGFEPVERLAQLSRRV